MLITKFFAHCLTPPTLCCVNFSSFPRSVFRKKFSYTPTQQEIGSGHRILWPDLLRLKDDYFSCIKPKTSKHNVCQSPSSWDVISSFGRFKSSNWRRGFSSHGHEWLFRPHQCIVDAQIQSFLGDGNKFNKHGNKPALLNYFRALRLVFDIFFLFEIANRSDLPIPVAKERLSSA